jgi:hypothetical protein
VLLTTINTTSYSAVQTAAWFRRKKIEATLEGVIEEKQGRGLGMHVSSANSTNPGADASGIF